MILDSADAGSLVHAGLVLFAQHVFVHRWATVAELVVEEEIGRQVLLLRVSLYLLHQIQRLLRAIIFHIFILIF